MITYLKRNILIIYFYFITIFFYIYACWSCALLSGVRTVPPPVGVARPRAGSLALPAPLYRPPRLPVTVQSCARSLLAPLNARSLEWKQRKLFGRPANFLLIATWNHASPHGNHYLHFTWNPGSQLALTCILILSANKNLLYLTIM